MKLVTPNPLLISNNERKVCDTENIDIGSGIKL